MMQERHAHLTKAYMDTDLFNTVPKGRQQKETQKTREPEAKQRDQQLVMRVRQHPARQGSSSGANTEMQSSPPAAGKTGSTLSKKAVDAKGAT